MKAELEGWEHINSYEDEVRDWAFYDEEERRSAQNH